MSEELGERLRRERLRRRELQNVTADRFGISQPNYSRWESGEYRVGQSHFAEVAEFLGLKIEEVWTMANGETPPTSLDLIREEIDGLKRDVGDLRVIVARLAGLIEKVESAKAPARRSAAKTGNGVKPVKAAGRAATKATVRKR